MVIAISDYFEGNAKNLQKCSYFDEDILDNCEPVDCSRKYNGQRLYYSSVEHRCLTTPIVGETCRINKPSQPRKKSNLPSKVRIFVRNIFN